MKPLVYVAGPISAHPMHATHRALEVAADLLDSGLVVPFVPHLSVLWDMVTPRPYEEWMAYDFSVLDHCHALYRLNGESEGADREVTYMRARPAPVFHEAHGERHRLLAWANQWAGYQRYLEMRSERCQQCGGEGAFECEHCGARREAS